MLHNRAQSMSKQQSLLKTSEKVKNCHETCTASPEHGLPLYMGNYYNSLYLISLLEKHRKNAEHSDLAEKKYQYV